MPTTPDPIEVARAVPAAPTDPSAVSRLAAEDATSVSLDDGDPELKKVTPWCGTGRGPRGIVGTFAAAMSFRTRGAWHLAGDPDGGEVTVGAEDR